jgi:hypothetical protein
MKPEQQRIAIAEACGIVFKNQWGSVYKTRKGVVTECPDYCNDLNAMHDAEKILEAEDNHAYGRYCSDLYEEHGNTVSLTAVQRAETFLKILDLWDK